MNESGRPGALWGRGAVPVRRLWQPLRGDAHAHAARPLPRLRGDLGVPAAVRGRARRPAGGDGLRFGSGAAAAHGPHAVQHLCGEPALQQLQRARVSEHDAWFRGRDPELSPRAAVLLVRRQRRLRSRRPHPVGLPPLHPVGGRLHRGLLRPPRAAAHRLRAHLGKPLRGRALPGLRVRRRGRRGHPDLRRLREAAPHGLRGVPAAGVLEHGDGRLRVERCRPTDDVAHGLRGVSALDRGAPPIPALAHAAVTGAYALHHPLHLRVALGPRRHDRDRVRHQDPGRGTPFGFSSMAHPMDVDVYDGSRFGPSFN